MTSAMDEVFGVNPRRPDHDDFWKLISLILRFDGAAEAGENPMPLVAKFIDLRSLHYVSRERSKRLMQLANEHGMRPLATVTTSWKEGFITGVAWAMRDVPDVGQAAEPEPGAEERP